MKLPLEKIDPLVTELAMCLASSVDVSSWLDVRFAVVFIPSGDTGSLECKLTTSPREPVEGWYPSNDVMDRLYDLSKRHWQLTQDLGQARWYKMIVTVERSGKFSVNFEYKADYQEGDILKRG